MRALAIVCCASLALPVAHADDADFVTVGAGQLPLVLSAPHGGARPVPGAPVRVRSELPRFQTVRDEQTSELAEQLAAALERGIGKKPYVVILRADRKYVDVNRPAEQAYESEHAKPVYDAFHAALRKTCDAVREKWGHGLLIDIHGQTVEPAAIFRGTVNLESLTALRQRSGPEAYQQLDRALEKHGFRVLPPVNERETRFIGGHIVRTYGSHQPNGIDAIQWEFGSDLRQPEVVEQTAKDAAKALTEFFRAQYLK